MGSNLCVWHRAQPIVNPMNAEDVASTRSIDVLDLVLVGDRSALEVDHVIAVEARRHFLSRVAFGSRSPASCSTMNWSNGRLRLNALMTQSRQGHMPRTLSMW